MPDREHQIFPVPRNCAFGKDTQTSGSCCLKSTFPMIFDVFCKDQRKGTVLGGRGSIPPSQEPPGELCHLYGTFGTKATTNTYTGFGQSLKYPWNILRGWKLGLIFRILGQKPQVSHGREMQLSRTDWRDWVTHSRNSHCPKTQLHSECKTRKNWVSATQIPEIICVF